MNAIPPAGIAIHNTRMLLVAAGLTAVEADRFVQRLTGEIAAGSLSSHEERLKFVEREISRLEQAQMRAQGGSGDLRSMIIDVISGLAANVIYDLGKTFVQRAPTVPSPAPEILPPAGTENAEQTIRVEWACAYHTLPELQLSEPLIDGIMRALHQHQWAKGIMNPLAAVYLDGVGMFLDGQAHHREAERVRRQAVKISQKVDGPPKHGSRAF
jgi:hypothetical protein